MSKCPIFADATGYRCKACGRVWDRDEMPDERCEDREMIEDRPSRHGTTSKKDRKPAYVRRHFSAPYMQRAR